MAGASEPERGDELPSALALIGLSAMAAWAFWDRWLYLTQSPLPFGVDGYWYPIQLRSLLSSGHLYYPASPLTLWLMAPLAALTDPIRGAKLGAALAAAALPLVTYPVARRVSGERAGGLVGAAVVTSSAGSFYLATEFVKNAVALPLGFGYLAALGWALERPSRRRAAAPAALLAATLLAHWLVFAFALAASAPALLLAVRERSHARPRARAIAVAAAALALAAALSLAVQRDHALLRHLLARRPDWSLPVLRVGDRALRFRWEPALAGVAGAGVLALALLARRSSRVRAAAPARDCSLAWGAAGWAVLLAIPWLDASDPQGLPYRVRVMAFAPLALAAPALAAAALASLGPRWRMSALMLLTGLALYRPGRYQAPVVRADPDLVAAVASARGRTPPGAILISPERHLVFMAVWYTGVKTRLSAESVPPARRWRLVPKAYMSDDLIEAVDRARADPDLAPPASLHAGNPDGLVLMPEATWRWALAQLAAPTRAYYESWPVH